VDLEARIDVVEHLRFAIGADNLFDKYPEPFPPVLNSTGNAPFSNYAPFGRSGRFLYGRLTYSF
jgi:iron complex outermembrane receptor protein